MLARNDVSRTIIGATAAIVFAFAMGAARAQTVAPQTVTPAPLPPEAKPDTPGGAARNGVIAPPVPAADADINRGVQSMTAVTPVIPPPGSPGGNPTVVPK